jgi:hypothetical protein
MAAATGYKRECGSSNNTQSTKRKEFYSQQFLSATTTSQLHHADSFNNRRASRQILASQNSILNHFNLPVGINLQFPVAIGQVDFSFATADKTLNAFTVMNQDDRNNRPSSDGSQRRSIVI